MSRDSQVQLNPEGPKQTKSFFSFQKCHFSNKILVIYNLSF